MPERRHRILYEREGGWCPLAVGNFMADAFKIVSEFDAYVCMRCGFTEFYRKT